MDIIYTCKHMHKRGQAHRSDTNSQHPCKPKWQRQPHPASFSGWAEWKSTTENIHIHICTIGKEDPSSSWTQTLSSLHSSWHRRPPSPVADTDRTIQDDLCAVTPGDTWAFSHPARSPTGSLKPPGYSGAGQPWSPLDPSISWHHGHTECPPCGVALVAAVIPSCTQMNTEQGAVAWGGDWRECKTAPLPDRAQPNKPTDRKQFTCVWSFSSP